jgi:hypothetical protein
MLIIFATLLKTTNSLGLQGFCSLTSNSIFAVLLKRGNFTNPWKEINKCP